jgi:hypothetical protein
MGTLQIPRATGWIGRPGWIGRAGATDTTRESGGGGRPIEYGNGYRLSPYSDIGPTSGMREGRFLGRPGEPQRRLWHASSGSSG